jgi:NADPH-dependent 2,4-dienoyl-CoA reductase/sulfur reductase-like enzyme
MQQGRIAAHNMAGKEKAFDGVPFFWTRQFDVGLVYVGHAQEWDEIVYQGEVTNQDFIALYISGNRVLAAAGMNRDQEMAAIEELMRLDQMPTADQLKHRSANFLELLKTTGSADNRQVTTAVANDVIASGVTPQIQLG